MQNTESVIKPPYSLLWDECDFIASKSQELLESGIAETENDAYELAALDHEMLEFEFEDFLEKFDSILKEISSAGCFFVKGRNMGWRHRTGSLDLMAADARAFIAKAFPKTSEWTLRGFFDRDAKILTYNLWHHDAPTGEFNTVRQGTREH